jgi:hypothetical protein
MPRHFFADLLGDETRHPFELVDAVIHPRDDERGDFEMHA